MTEDLQMVGALQLFPCVPKAMKVYTNSEHPFRVPIAVVRKEKQKGTVTPPASSGENGTVDDAAIAAESLQEAQTTTTYYVHPEWKAPKEREQLSIFGVKEWEWAGDETMHPFWAIRRLGATQLSKEPPGDKTVAGFTAAMTAKEFTVVTVGCVPNQSVAMTLVVQVPFITNQGIMERGTELIMEQPEVKKEVKRRSTWKEASKAKLSKLEAEKKKAANGGRGDTTNQQGKQKPSGAPRGAPSVTEI